MRLTRRQRELALDRAMVGADLELVEINRVVLDPHFGCDRCRLAVDLAFEADGVRPASLGQRLQWPQVAFHRDCDVANRAAKARADRRFRIARMKRQRIDGDSGGLARLAVAKAQRAMIDSEIANGERVKAPDGRWGCTTAAGSGELPVALPSGIRFQSDNRIDELETYDFEAALEKGQQLDLGLDALGGQHLRRLAPFSVAQAHVVDQQLRFQGKLEVDAAANDQISSGGILDALLNGRNEIVDVDRPDRDRNRDDQQDEQAADGGEDSPEQAH